MVGEGSFGAGKRPADNGQSWRKPGSAGRASIQQLKWAIFDRNTKKITIHTIEHEKSGGNQSFSEVKMSNRYAKPSGLEFFDITEVTQKK
jgi:hypothetical protein